MQRLTKVPAPLVPAALGTLATLLFVHVTPPGQPYDEPAHWSNVVFYATRHRMPVLGEQGTQYEAQMGPAYYALSALISGTPGAGTDEGRFWAVRVAWVLLIPLLVVLTAQTAAALGAPRRTQFLAAALVAVNPLMLAMGSTVQNDYLAIVAATAAVLLGARLLRVVQAPWWRHALLGVVIGLAILVKVVALALLGAVLLTHALRTDAPLRDRVTQAVATATGVAAASGWWFVRNLSLYGDLTGAQGIDTLGISFPPMRLTSPEQTMTWLGSIVSYAFIPVEYYRNTVNAPVALEALAVAAAVAALVIVGRALLRRGAARPPLARRLRSDPARLLVVSVLVMTAVAYLAYALAVAWIAARLLFLAAPIAAVAVSLAARDRNGTALLTGILTAFVVVDVWLLVSLAGLPRAEYWIF